jgi:rhodanese-related sulfurtransferase
MAVLEIDVDELARRLEAQAVLIDVREPDEYVSGHVPGALLIPMSDVPDRVADFPVGPELLLVCRSGARSMRVGEFLDAQGRTCVNVAGGTLAWVASGREVVAGNEPT